jgi:hypothetical protein
VRAAPPAQAIVGADEGPVEVRHIISWIKDDATTFAPPPPIGYKANCSVAGKPGAITLIKSMDGFRVTATPSATPLILFM